MTIRVVCRNGHALKVSDSSAGKSGPCPVCKVLVEIPLPEPAPTMSEDALMDLLGTKSPSDSPSSLTRDSSVGDAMKKASSVGRPPMKACIKCNREMDVSVRICPHCHTYVGGAGERRNA